MNIFNRPEELIPTFGKRIDPGACCRGTQLTMCKSIFRYLQPDPIHLPNTKESILETVEKIKNKKNPSQIKREALESEYLKLGKTCLNCNKIMDYHHRNSKFCSKNCLYKKTNLLN